eukprot:m.1117523 g.1117523  ORF g.1117523 m.1117523 type:complete len:377 (+) comp24380_c0_seq22:6948-8078(+)
MKARLLHQESENRIIEQHQLQSKDNACASGASETKTRTASSYYPVSGVNTHHAPRLNHENDDAIQLWEALKHEELEQQSKQNGGVVRAARSAQTARNAALQVGQEDEAPHWQHHQHQHHGHVDFDDRSSTAHNDSDWSVMHPTQQQGRGDIVSSWRLGDEPSSPAAEQVSGHRSTSVLTRVNELMNAAAITRCNADLIPQDASKKWLGISTTGIGSETEQPSRAAISPKFIERTEVPTRPSGSAARDAAGTKKVSEIQKKDEALATTHPSISNADIVVAVPVDVFNNVDVAEPTVVEVAPAEADAEEERARAEKERAAAERLRIAQPPSNEVVHIVCLHNSNEVYCMFAITRVSPSLLATFGFELHAYRNLQKSAW